MMTLKEWLLMYNLTTVIKVFPNGMASLQDEELRGIGIFGIKSMTRLGDANLSSYENGVYWFMLKTPNSFADIR